ncbi:MAG: hypothetical protein ACFCU2_09210 [Acidimicrobiia bacterium]
MDVLAHEDEVVIEVTDEGTRQNLLEGFEIGDQVGNPLYSIVDEHSAVYVLFLMLPLIPVLCVRFLRKSAARGNLRSARVMTDYAYLPLARRWAVWALATSALVHLMLVFTHELSGYSALYLAGAIGLAMATRWTLRGTDSKKTTMIVVGSVVAFWFFGAPPDQVGVVTKLIELFALALIAVPGGESSRRLAPIGVVALVVLNGVAIWIGAFAAQGEDGGHHGGEYPGPGTVVPYIQRLEPTAEEQVAADELYAQVKSALAKFEDPLVAEAYGYDVLPIVGRDHHADNPEYLEDGRIFDPERPETLVYAETPRGPVLLGAMFQMPFNEPAPRVGGPLTVWHSHENVCISLVPPSMVGLLSPYGVCPLGSVNIPSTNEMIHAWTLPGVEDGWGHIEDEWLEQYLNDVSAASG